MIRTGTIGLIIALTLAIAVAHGQSAGFVVKLPSDKIDFKAPLAGLPQSAILYGDPKKAGLYVSRVKFPAGIKIMPHTHADEVRTVMIMSGTMYFGLGEQWDESKLEVYPPGTFFTEPGNTPHFAWAKDGEVIAQFTAIGPTGTTFIPQKK